MSVDDLARFLLSFGEASVAKERIMERRIELGCGLGASLFGLVGVVTEAQALSNPVTNPTLSWLLGMHAVPGVWTAIQTAQHLLLPIALVFIALALGAYLHSVHELLAGLALLLGSSAVALAIIGFAVFNITYVEILFVPAPLVVLTAGLAAAASTCALSSLGRLACFIRRMRERPARHAQVRSPEGV
jgi:hypothetical protein